MDDEKGNKGKTFKLEGHLKDIEKRMDLRVWEEKKRERE